MYYFSSFLYFTLVFIYYYFLLQFLLLLHYIPKENNVLSTPYIFPDTQKYSLHFECLAGQEHFLIHTLKETIPGHPYCI
jgi:hypothetical protein